MLETVKIWREKKGTLCTFTERESAAEDSRLTEQNDKVLRCALTLNARDGFLWSRLVNAGLRPNLWQRGNASGAAQMQLQAAAFNENICISSPFAPVAETTSELSGRTLFWFQHWKKDLECEY